MKIIKIILLCILMLLCRHKVFAQDTLKITIEQAEKQFLEKNLQLLAERYNIAIADAAIVQARVLNNPTIGVGDINFWHPNAAEEVEAIPATWGNGIIFSIELEQVIRTAGKRKKLINLEKVAKEIAIQEFETFLLSLKTELRTILHEVIYLQSYLNIIQTNQKSVETLVESYKTNLSRGNVAKGELIRLQSSLIELEAEANEIQTELNDQYKELKVLLNIPPQTQISIVPTTATTKNPNDISLIDLFEMAKKFRPEFLLSDLDIQYQERLLKYEKAQRSPDIALSVNYDRYGGVWKNFFGIGISLDIPMFDRNQGNIKIAKLSIDQANYNAEHQKNEIQHEIATFYNNYKINYHFYKKHTENDFSENLDDMFEVYTRNFLNRNISMLEYLDFMEAYRTTKQVILTAKKNLDTSFAELQFSVNNEIK
ncbi:MAG: TolC family protein [Bacteroidetes bacterium]|nr:TolC family protein [Bacteroidota bacterium]MCL2301685.1 TolC family protein [Lentimicrobiaceae bacterium]